MAAYHNKTFAIDDEYMTPKKAWEDIKDFIPKDKILWEAFYGDGKSGEYLQEMGFNVIHKKVDFFTNDLGDIVVSNPPFTKKKEVLTRLKELNKPLILIMKSSVINTLYMRKLFKKNDLKIAHIIRVTDHKIDVANLRNTEGKNYHIIIRPP